MLKAKLPASHGGSALGKSSNKAGVSQQSTSLYSASATGTKSRNEAARRSRETTPTPHSTEDKASRSSQSR